MEYNGFFSTAIFYIWNDYISIIKTRIHFSKNICIYISSVHFLVKEGLLRALHFYFQRIFVYITHKLQYCIIKQISIYHSSTTIHHIWSLYEWFISFSTNTNCDGVDVVQKRTFRGEISNKKLEDTTLCL